jgi:zinc protease
MLRSTFIAALCAVSLALPAAADNILPFKATEATLPNGLKVIVVPTGFPNIVSVYITMQTGSRHEVEPGKSGFAHFFEHMMFRGTPKYPNEVYTSIITKTGARQNASTSDDWTMYYTTFAKEDLEKILEIEADRFQNLSYSEGAFKTESRAVRGEYDKNSATPITKLNEVQRNAAYTTHTYKHTTMGFIEDIEDMPNQFAYSKTFFDRWYRPEYATLTIAGDVDPAKVLPLVEKYWGNWKRGTQQIEIPQEPPAKAAVYAHVPWTSPTIPWVTVAFRGPSFLQMKEQAAMSTAFDVAFGQTSDIYKRLVEQEQKIDRLFADPGNRVDPTLVTVYARVKNMKDVVAVRDDILATFASLTSKKLDVQSVEDSKSSARYSFVRGLDNTDAIASRVARAAVYERSYDTLNRFYDALAAVTPDDIQKTAQKYFTDANLVVTTLSRDPMPEQIKAAPALASFIAAPSTGDVKIISQKSLLPNVMVKLLFTTGSASDPAGKKGLAALSAAMITEAGSKAMRIDEINKALYPIASSFGYQVDKDMTTFTGVVHRDKWTKFVEVALPQLLTPGLREDDFKRLKDAQLNSLKQDLRNQNEEELGKEELQNLIFAGTPYGHTVLGTVSGLEAITLDDVRRFIAANYTRANVVVGMSGDYPGEFETRLKSDLAQLPTGEGSARALASLPAIRGAQPTGLNLQIIQKDTRATAISMGFPLPITREDADFAALNIARAWLGEHRMSSGQLYNRLREVRGLNYGDYAYIEYFNRPGAQFFPSPNIGRRTQLFEIWIRPVVPENTQMSMRIALYELQRLIDKGLTQEQFETTRDYLMKNVYLMTANQNQRLGYALDSWWYGMPEYTEAMRAQYAKLTRADVNRAVKKHLSAKNLHVVIVTKDAPGLRDLLVKEAFSSIKYDAPKPELAAEDKIIGAYKLEVKNVRIVPVDEVFAK